MSTEGGHGFTRTTAGRIVIRLDDVERGLLRTLTDQLIELIEVPEAAEQDDPLASMVGIDADAVRPQDPALLRLLPDAYPDDSSASDDFRRFTERGLRAAKTEAARTVAQTLERSGVKVTLTAGEAAAWLSALNDIRLALGARLGIDTDGWRPDPRADDGLGHVYDWLTFVQDSLVNALMPSTGFGAEQ